MRRFLLSLATLTIAGVFALGAPAAARQGGQELAYPPQPQGQPQQDVSHARIVRLSYVEGDVQIARPEDEGWEQALQNMPIQQGYALATFRGRAEIEFESGATVRIGENTQIQFTELSLVNGGRVTQITVTQGRASFYANLAREDSFAVLTPGLQVNIPKNARFRMDVTEKDANIAVLKGDVLVEARAGTYKLTKNQALLFRAEDADNVVVARSGEPDEFDRWVADRDDALNSGRTASLRYVNAPFRYGVSDLSTYGNWVYVPTYGYTWQPYGIGAGWSPYFSGRWVFVRGYGWTWVSYEPWGWVPYHYGSWAFVNIGWVWVPGHFSYWHPGHVVWLSFGNSYGWCPRSPWDRGGRHHNLQHGVVVNTSVGIITGGHNLRPGSGDRIDETHLLHDPPGRDQFGSSGKTMGGRGNGRPVAGTGAITPRRPDGEGREGMPGRTPENPRGTGANGFSGSTTGGRPRPVLTNDDVERRGRDLDRPGEGFGKGTRGGQPAGATVPTGRPDGIPRANEDRIGNAPVNSQQGTATVGPPQAGTPQGNSGGQVRGRPVTPRGDIEYDPREGRYVNPNQRPSEPADRMPASPSGQSNKVGSSPRPMANDGDGPRGTPRQYNDAPRNAPQPSGGVVGGRSDAPRSYSPPAPRSEPSRPSSPPPAPARMEPSRPASPPPAPRVESPRPSSPPPVQRPSSPPPVQRPSSPRAESRSSFQSRPSFQSRSSSPSFSGPSRSRSESRPSFQSRPSSPSFSGPSRSRSASRPASSRRH